MTGDQAREHPPDADRDDPRTLLGHQIGRRWHRPGPARHARLGVLASSSRRFVTGMGRGGLVRRAYSRPATVPLGRPHDLTVSPPRWWREAHLLAEDASPPATSAPATSPSAASPSRGLARALRPMPSAAPGRPQGSLMTSAPQTVPMRLPSEVAAVGRLTTPADTAARRIDPGREPGPSEGADSRSSAPAPSAGGRAPRTLPRPATVSSSSVSSSPVIQDQAIDPGSNAGSRPAAGGISVAMPPVDLPGPGRPTPTIGLARLAPRLARRRAAVEVALPRPQRDVARLAASPRLATSPARSAGAAAVPGRAWAGRTPSASPLAERTRAERSRTTPAQSERIRAEPPMAGSARTEPTRTRPAQATPLPAEPTQSEPTQSAGSESSATAVVESSRSSGRRAGAAGPATLRTALRRMWSSTARLVRADPLTSAYRSAPGRAPAGAVTPVPRLGTHRVRPSGGWPGAVRDRLDTAVVATRVQEGPVQIGRIQTTAPQSTASQDERSGSQRLRAATPAGPTRMTPPKTQSGSSHASLAARVETPAGSRPPALVRRLDAAPASRLPGATGRHWRAQPPAARRLPSLGIESPDLLSGASPAEGLRAPVAGASRRVVTPDPARVRPQTSTPARPRPTDRSRTGHDLSAGPIDRSPDRHDTTSLRPHDPNAVPSAVSVRRTAHGTATRSARRFPWLVSTAPAEIAPPSRGLPKVPAVASVHAHPTAARNPGEQPSAASARSRPPQRSSGRRTSLDRLAAEISAPSPVPGRHRPSTEMDAASLAGIALSTLAGAEARVAPPRTVIQRLPAPSVTPQRPTQPPEPSEASAPGGGGPGVSFPIVRRWAAAAIPSTPGAAMRDADDRPLLGSQRTEEPGLLSGVMARVDERIQAHLTNEFDTELSDRVHRIIDERLSAEQERWAWRREAGGF